MNPIATISSINSGLYFSLFYMLSFVLSLLVILVYGLKKKFHVASLFSLMTTGVIFFILGDKLFASTLEEWGQILQNLNLPLTGKKTILGGLLGLMFGLWFAKKVLRIDISIFEPLAIALPISMAIQRIGCLMAGCCFGRPTTLPWAITYAKGSMPHSHHVNQGLVHLSEMTSLSIHPTQFYQMIFCLLIAFLVFKSRKMWKSQYSILVSSVLLYVLFRFFSEFFRDPIANGIAGQVLWGLKYVQWGLLGGMIFLVAVLVYNERIMSNKTHDYQTPNVIIQSSVALLFMLLLSITGDFFNPVEKLTIHLILIPTLICSFWNLYKTYTAKNLRWAIPVIFIVSLGLMSQTYLPENYNEKVTFSEIGFSAMLSEYYDEVKQFTGTGTDCEGDKTYILSNPQVRRYTTYLGGFQYAYNSRTEKYNRFKFEVSGFYASDHVISKTNTETLNYDAYETTYGLSPYFQFDWRMIGFGVGFHLGKLRYAAINRDGSDMDLREWQNNPGEYNFFPRVRLRAGPYDIAFFETSVANFTPSSSPMPLFMVGLGSGLGKVDGTKIAAGYSDAGIYLQGVYPIKDKYVISAFISNNFKPDYSARYVVSLGFKYRFNFKTVPKAWAVEKQISNVE